MIAKTRKKKNIGSPLQLSVIFLVVPSPRNTRHYHSVPVATGPENTVLLFEFLDVPGSSFGAETFYVWSSMRDLGYQSLWMSNKAYQNGLYKLKNFVSILSRD